MRLTTSYADEFSGLLDDEEQRREQEAADEAAAAAAPPPPEPGPDVAGEEAAGDASPAAELEPPPAAEPSAPEPSEDDDDPFAGLAPLDYGQNPVELEPPPQRARRSDGPAALGLGLDILLNKGRHVPQMVAQFAQPDDVEYDNWKRRLEWAKARAGRGGAMNPYNLAIRAAELRERTKYRKHASQIADENAKTRAAAQKAKEDELARKHNATDPRTQATQDWIIAHSNIAPDSAEADRIRQMDDTALGRVMSGMLKDAETRPGASLATQDTTHAAEKAGAVSAATQPYKLEVAQTLAHARGEESRLTGIAGKATTREIGEAEMTTTMDAMSQMLQRRDPAIWAKAKGAAAGLVGARGAALPEEAAYNSAKQALINSAEKMVTMGVPHAEAVRAAAENLPGYTDGGALEQLQNVRTLFSQMAASGGAAIERAKDEYGPPGSGRAPAAVDVPASLGTTPSAGPKVNRVVKPRGGTPAPAAHRKTAKQLADEGWD